MLNVPYTDPSQSNNLSDSASGGTTVLDPLCNPHEFEQNVWRELQLVPGGRFSSLTVRRMDDGVCLQGVLETSDNDCLGDVTSLVKRVACVDRVLNQIVVRQRHASAKQFS